MTDARNSFGEALAAIPNAKSGIYLPADWGKNWRKARSQSGQRNVVVENWAASIWNGFYSSNWQRKVGVEPTGVEGLVMAALQDAYGDGGSGFISVYSTNGNVAGSASTITATGATGTAVGGWDLLGNGPNSAAFFPHAAANGATLTDTNVRGTAIDIYWMKVSTTNSFTYSIDGAPAVTVPNQVAVDGNIGVTTITGLSDSTHTLVLTATVGQVFIYGWTGRRAAGVLPIRMGHAGRVTSDVLTGPAFSALTEEGGLTGGVSIQKFAPDLLIIADMGINDVSFGVTPDTFAAALAQTCAYARAGNPNCELVVAMSHFGTLTTDAPVRTVADGATTLNSAVITSTAASWTANDLGAVVTGTGIPAGSTILSIVPGAPTQVNLSKQATATGATLALTIQRIGPAYPRYMAVARGVAETYGALLIDYWALGQNAGANWTAQQFLGDGTNDGQPGVDTVHPSNKGHAYMASVAISLLTA